MSKVIHLLCGCCFLFMLPMWSQAKVRLVGVDPVNGIIAVKNFYTTPIPLSQYKLSYNQTDTTISQMEVISGDTLMLPKAYIFLRVRGLRFEDGFVALHDLRYGQKMGTTAAMADFMQWGSGGHRFDSLADATYTISFNSMTMQNDTIRRWVQGTYLNFKAPFSFFGGSLDYGYKFWQSYKLPQMGLKIITVVPSRNRVTIKNLGVSNTDISGLNICADSGCVDSASSLILNYGSLNIAKNDSVVLEGIPMGDSVGCVSIFFPLNTRDTTNIIDFVQWGAASQPNASFAHIKGMNDSNQFVSCRRHDTLYYIGNNSSQQYSSAYWLAWRHLSEGTDTTHQDTLGMPGFQNSKLISIYPNPVADDRVYLNFSDRGVAPVRIINSNGQMISEQYLNDLSQPVSLVGLLPGYYIIQFQYSNGTIQHYKLNKL